jgi:hypothetical protein
MSPRHGLSCSPKPSKIERQAVAVLAQPARIFRSADIPCDYKNIGPTGRLQIMNSTHEYAPLTKSSGTQWTIRSLVEWGSNLPAVVFNTGFAVLAIVTLCGIVFVTKPKGVMHDIPPEMWLPLLLVMAPAQTYAQFLSWSTIFAGKAPTGPAIALRQMKIPGLWKPAVALLWLCNFCVGFGIVVSLSSC